MELGQSLTGRLSFGLNRKDGFDLDGDVVWKGSHPNRRARMGSRLAQDLDEEIRAAIDDLRMIG